MRKFYIESAESSGPCGVTVYLRDLNDETFEEEAYVTIEDVLRHLKDQNSNYNDLKI